MNYAKKIDEIPKNIWKEPKPGEPEPLARLLDGQDLITPGKEGGITGSERLKILVQNYRPGGSHRSHVHDDCEQVFFVAEGEGELMLDGKWFDVSKGDLIFVPRNVSHAARNNSEGTLVIIFISVPLDRTA